MRTHVGTSKEAGLNGERRGVYTGTHSGPLKRHKLSTVEKVRGAIHRRTLFRFMGPDGNLAVGRRYHEKIASGPIFSIRFQKAFGYKSNKASDVF